MGPGLRIIRKPFKQPEQAREDRDKQGDLQGERSRVGVMRMMLVLDFHWLIGEPTVRTVVDG